MKTLIAIMLLATLFLTGCMSAEKNNIRCEDYAKTTLLKQNVPEEAFSVKNCKTELYTDGNIGCDCEYNIKWEDFDGHATTRMWTMYPENVTYSEVSTISVDAIRLKRTEYSCAAPFIIEDDTFCCLDYNKDEECDLR